MARLSDFQIPIGSYIEPGDVRGYYVDLREKAGTHSWPPPWFPFPGFHRFIALGQWGLGAFERYLAGEGEAWLDGAVAASNHLLETQERSPTREGAWLELEDYPHTFQMRGPWPSAMAQGHCASLLVRTYRERRDARFADAARAALSPMRILTKDGGAMALLGGRPFPEEYPTTPPSYVLNGAIYALWGAHDVWRGLDDSAAGAMFNEAVETLAANLHRWDTGYWSRYDLFPHPGTINVASASYHALHINQLRVLHQLAPNPVFAETADRFEQYAARLVNRTLAFAHKAAFRLITPRNHFLARKLPWGHAPHESKIPRD